ncbi:MAG: SMP-30/gluconolactonase/LRE family protein [Acidobacteria bacterium]|nr:SMP-30/gluconolactonase/LRE family protein [Acidobacteriota bacterium]
MAVDVEGNIYTTDAGRVRIYDADGRMLEEIDVPEEPANVCFGGEDFRTLFITARTSLYSVRVKHPGAKPGGGRVWTTFMGSASFELAYDIDLDGGGNIHVSGIGYATWGDPVNPYSRNQDGFVAKLTGSGEMVWNTFLGSVAHDYVNDMAVDENGNIYLAGTSQQSWGNPVNPVTSPYTSPYEAFAVKLDTGGNIAWNTFMGSASDDEGIGVAVDGYGNVYVTGYSSGNWGDPDNDHTSGSDYDAFAAKLDGNGVRKWNTFMGSTGTERSDGIAVNGKGDFHITGKSQATWGSPVNPHAGNFEIFVVKFAEGNTAPWIPLLLLD